MPAGKILKACLDSGKIRQIFSRLCFLRMIAHVRQDGITRVLHCIVLPQLANEFSVPVYYGKFHEAGALMILRRVGDCHATDIIVGHALEGGNQFYARQLRPGAPEALYQYLG